MIVYYKFVILIDTLQNLWPILTKPVLSRKISILSYIYTIGKVLFPDFEWYQKYLSIYHIQSYKHEHLCVIWLGFNVVFGFYLNYSVRYFPT